MNKGLSFKAIETIERLIKSKFDNISMDILGLKPKVQGKSIIFSTEKNSLIKLFATALKTTNPTSEEEVVLKKILKVASGYLDALRDRTTARAIHKLDAHVVSSKNQNKPTKINDLSGIIEQEMSKAKHQIKLIANAESQKTINTGTALQISRMSSQKGEEDPIVFFVVTIDDVTGPEEFVLHLLPDRKTPRVWKLSEIGADYHKVGDPNPKLPGLHPNCFVGNSGVGILTEKDGYKNIKDVVIGDRVLTHTGRFKKVLNTLEWYDKKYYGKFIEIKFKTMKRDGEQTATLRVTPDHKFMTQRGWVKAGELKNTDKFRHLIDTPKNHNSEYFFEDIDLISVETIKNGKAGYKLYDITVEDDESFVVNGIVSHNCRCRLTYLSPGFGFGEDGRVKFIGRNHDEFKVQREKYGKPR